MNLPNGWRWRRARRRLARTLWVVPATYTVLALALAVVVARLDTDDPWDSWLQLSASSASTALAALGSGMIAFTGFVTSVILLVVQFGSSQFSPRFVRWFRDDPAVKHSLGTFIATFVFALCSTALTGRGATAIVPYRSLLGAVVLMLASIAWFLALIAHTSNNLQVARVTQRVDEQARQVFDVVYPASRSEVDAVAVAEATLQREDPCRSCVCEAWARSSWPSIGRHCWAWPSTTTR
jgi:uncharacterized membrane protein